MLMTELHSEPNNLGQDIGYIKARLNDLCTDIHSLKQNQKEFYQFMYKFQGGKAWLLGLLTVSATIGAIFSHLFGFIVPSK